MTKKLVGLLFVALFCVASINAATIVCNQTSAGTGNPATYTAGGSQAFLLGTVFTCNAPSVPTGYTITSVSFTVQQSFSQGQNGQTNTVQYSYLIGGFNGLTSLVTTSSSNPTSGSNGGATDLDGITSQGPNTDCVTTGNPLNIVCTETLPANLTSFSISGSSTWLAGGLANGGSDGFGIISATYTYAPTVSTPEPASLMMIGGGLVGLALVARRRKA